MVLLTFKNLQQKTFQVEIDVTLSVKQLKEKIEQERGKDYPAIGQKLIYAGKILQDDNKLEDYSMDVNKFLVIMVTKPKTTTPPPEAAVDPPATPATSAPPTESSSSTSTSTSTSTPSDTPSTTTTSSSSTPATTDSTSVASTTTTTASSTAESLLVMGDDFNKMVANIMEMGYERIPVERALRASFNNPYTAVQYLVDGIPQGVIAEAGAGADVGLAGALAAATAASRVATDDDATVPVPAVAAAAAVAGIAATEGDDPLAFLRNQPQFVQMTQMMRSNPQLLDAFLQQIRTTNPGLLQAIQDNQEAFVRMINQPAGSATSGGASAGGDDAAGQESGDEGARGEGGRNTTTIMLSQQDRDAIDRLRGLGNFPEELVVQAYFACEKNENLAAEFLFSQAWE